MSLHKSDIRRIYERIKVVPFARIVLYNEWSFTDLIDYASGVYALDLLDIGDFQTMQIGWRVMDIPAACMDVYNSLNGYIRDNPINIPSYNDYLRSRQWKLKRKLLLLFYGKCMLCGEVDGLHVHHNTYENLPLEQWVDLIVLCSRCHEDYHRNKKQLAQYAKQIMSWSISL